MAAKLDPEAEVFVPGRPWGINQEFSFAEEPAFVTVLKDVLYMLSMNPVAFYEYMSTVADALNDSIETDTQLESVAEVIFEQSILEPNFTYTGAKMCHFLFQNLKIPPEIKAFSSIINKRTKDIIINTYELLQAPETVGRIHGTCFFLAELFLMIEHVKDGKPMKVYAYRAGLQEVMDALLSIPNTLNLKCLAKLLKMIGGTVDEFDREKGDVKMSDKFQAIFDKLKHILVDEEVDKSVHFMCINLLELRARHWGKAAPPNEWRQHVVTAGGDAPQAAVFSDAPVYFDAGGKVISAEEANLNLDLDLEADFEDFIAENDEMGSLEADLSELEIPDDEAEYMPAGAGSSNDFDELDQEAEQALEQFVQDSKRGYSSRHWSLNS